MARGVPSPAPMAPLPKPSFVRIQEEVSTQPSGVHDLQARSYGYNDFSEFKRPEHYIRHIEPLESELAIQVEYDMDEQDQEWLDAVNAERKKEQLDKVSYETFEVIMDRLEKEWFDLTKNIPKPDMVLPSEDSTCAICDDSEGENSNAIVFCDGCNLAVHQDCYGVPYIPEGQWLCRKCTVSPENPVSCILCPNEGGAFKQTLHGDWVHLLCAIWVPETRVVNEVFMEPITGVDKIPKQRWKLRCSICDVREGACIQCNKASCFLAFHPTCARKDKLLMPMKSTHGSDALTLACYCEKHLPKEQQDARSAAQAAEQGDHEGGETRHAVAKAAKSARAYAKTYKLGPPLVPSIIVDRIMQYIGKIIIRKKMDFLLLVCKYWSLKREARRGAPLLKRLHLEPWTASAGGKQQTDEEKALKLEHMKLLRQDLETVRMLAELSRKRESRKLQQAEIVQEVFSHCLFPHEPALRLAFERIMGFDRHDFFKNPVSRNEVPDYFDVVLRPMCWNIIDDKLDKHEYWNIQSFKDDVNLVLDNAMLYNKLHSPYHKAADRIKNNAQPILEELSTLAVHSQVIQGNDDMSVDPKSSIGDLEPPMSIVDVLFSEDLIKDDINLILNAEPIVSLLSYELETLKPPPPPPPTPPPKIKISHKADKERRRVAKEAADGSSGFNVPRTRRAVAAAAAFEAEARGQSGLSNEVSHPSSKTHKKPSPHKKQPVSRRKDMPPLVKDVDSRESFKKFDEGWILPPGQRRGGRAPRAEITTPPKRDRAGEAKSRLPVHSTSAVENETLHGTSATSLREAGPSTSQVAIDDSDTAMDVDVVGESEDVRAQTSPVDPALAEIQGPMDTSSPLTAQPEEIENGAEISEESDNESIKTVIIEVLDTPATRREKAMRRKQMQKAAEDAMAAVYINIDSSTADPSSVPSAAEGDEVDSVMSELSDIESEREEVVNMVQDQEQVQEQQNQEEQEREQEQQEQERREQEQEQEQTQEDWEDRDREEQEQEQEQQQQQKQKQKQKEPVEGGAIVLGENEYLEGGTLVWAKADSYPWWAAVIFEPDDPAIPKKVLQQKRHVPRTGDGPLHLVRFYDKAASWNWLELNKLRLLGEDQGLDQEFLTVSKRQKFKTKKIRADCREAYRRAMQEMELDDPGDGGGGGTEESSVGVVSVAQPGSVTTGDDDRMTT